LIFMPLQVTGACILEPELFEDARGCFARTFCRNEFAAHGLVADYPQCSTSFNRRRGTLRGMHYQKAPHAEAKIVRVTAGSVFDVALDLRPGSSTYLKWSSAELTAENRRAFYIPPGCAHGFITLQDNTEMLYYMSEPFMAEYYCGARYNDPAFGIKWPFAPEIINPRDASYKDFEP